MLHLRQAGQLARLPYSQRIDVTPVWTPDGFRCLPELPLRTGGPPGSVEGDGDSVSHRVEALSKVRGGSSST